MPGLQDRTRKYSFSNEDINSFGEDVIYDDGELCGYKALTLNQIIGWKPSGIFQSSIPILYTFTLHGYAQVCKNPLIDTKSDFYQAKE